MIMSPKLDDRHILAVLYKSHSTVSGGELRGIMKKVPIRLREGLLYFKVVKKDQFKCRVMLGQGASGCSPLQLRNTGERGSLSFNSTEPGLERAHRGGTYIWLIHLKKCSHTIWFHFVDSQVSEKFHKCCSLFDLLLADASTWNHSNVKFTEMKDAKILSHHETINTMALCPEDEKDLKWTKCP
ncbi:hypothetical protein P5673_016241 [Acropora cervicornis]|uniref:Uncharacterized protein n=1 Tax=Acropora cervicornis TaxID=6130 RepID=A0AAD9QH30_ACRCE|nr:hypothetical protein P5673_016241 [Acropora cervicornis]